MQIQVSTAFDSGNIELLTPVVSAPEGQPTLVRLALRKDAGGEHMQWFHFRLTGVLGRELELRIENAGQASYPTGWQDYRACLSVDRRQWVRVPDTTVEDGALVIRLRARHDQLWLAYFAPYDQQRHLDLIGRAVASGLARYRLLGRTLDGRDLDLLRLGAVTGPALWVIGRQHPGESMASWWMEGFLGRLLDLDDAAARALLGGARIYCVPMMNPDGAVRGHLRTNACGANLNREWHEPTLDRSPEVRLVRDAMDATGVDFCLDVHGDEALPYVFLSGADGVPGFTERLGGLQDEFRRRWMAVCPDLQDTHGYPVAAPGQANMKMCTNQIADRFDCLAFTLEMPFKDNALDADPSHGWSPARCARLGASAVLPMLQVLDRLR